MIICNNLNNCFAFFRVLFGRDDENLSTSVISLLRSLKVDRRTIISLMIGNTNFRTLRAIKVVLKTLL